MMDEKNLNENEINEEFEEEDLGKTQEIDSLFSENNSRSITPRDEFIELNSADDMSKTLLMDSMRGDTASDAPVSDYIPEENEVKRRKKKPKHQVNHVRTMGHVFLGVVISVAAIALGVVLSINVIKALRDITGMAKPVKEAEIEIRSDMTTDEIVDSLHKGGIIEMPSLMKMYINMTDKKDSEDYVPFLEGTYTIYSNMSYSSIIDTLKTKKTYTETVTIMIPEGITALEVGQILEENYVCRAVDFEKYYKSKLNKYDFEEQIEDNPNRLNMLEGYLFPDTYEFYVIDDLKKNPNFDTTDNAKVVAETMYRNFESKISKSMKARMKELGMTLDEVVRLASIVQWEGDAEDNWEKISSVFHNRLNDPDTFPKLESDATETYIAMCITPKITSSNKDKMQAITEAYDTYNCTGLPAGAICNPGLDTINAVLYPAETSYYYFLANKDGDFYYAKTLEQHEQNIIDAGLQPPEQTDEGETY